MTKSGRKNVPVLGEAQLETRLGDSVKFWNRGIGSGSRR